MKGKNSMFGYCDSKMKTEASMSMQPEGTGLRDKGLRKRLNNFFFSLPSVFVCKICTQSSLVPELSGRLWI